MEALKKRIYKQNIHHDLPKQKDLVDYNTNRHHIFLRLNAILYNEKKSDRYCRIIYRLFHKILLYLELRKSKTITVIIKNNKKYYYSSRLYIEDIEDFFLNTKLSDSTKNYYMNLLKKYIKILNRNTKLHFTNNVINPKKKKTDIPQIIKNIFQNLKDLGNDEYFCLFYFLFFFGLSIYQISKLCLKNVNEKNNSISFISYKNRHRIAKQKKIPKVISSYFKDFYESKKLDNGFLFFSDLKDKINNTRKNQIENIIISFLKKDLKIKSLQIKSFIELFNDERPSIRLGGISKQIFNKNAKVIDFDLFE